MNYVAIDIETSGFNDGIHDILQIALVEYKDLLFTPTGVKFVSYIKPVNPKIYDVAAYEQNKINLEWLLKSAPTPAQVRKSFLEWKYELFGDEKLLPLGHNYDGFDKMFIKKWLSDLYNDVFDYHSRDSWKIADICKTLGKIPTSIKCNLGALSSYFNLPNEGIHHAYEDCLLSLDIYRKCLELLK